MCNRAWRQLERCGVRKRCGEDDGREGEGIRERDLEVVVTEGG